MTLSTENMYKRSQLLLWALLGNKNLCEQWWNSPNKAFDMQTPKEMWDKDPEQVYGYLMHYGYR